MAMAFGGANTTKIYWYNESSVKKSTTKASGGQACNPDFIVENLKLTSMCSDDPSVERRWRVRNTNAFSVKYKWEVYGTDQQETLLAAPGDSFFFTATVGGANTTKIKWQNEAGVWKETVKASGGAACSSNARMTTDLQTVSQSEEVTASFALYPNPAVDRLHIVTGQKGDMIIYNLEGKKVLERQIEGALDVALDKFQKGLYLYRFNTLDGTLFQGKLIIE